MKPLNYVASQTFYSGLNTFKPDHTLKYTTLFFFFSGTLLMTFTGGHVLPFHFQTTFMALNISVVMFQNLHFHTTDIINRVD